MVQSARDKLSRFPAGQRMQLLWAWRDEAWYCPILHEAHETLADP
jgi:hypothetical protein